MSLSRAATRALPVLRAEDQRAAPRRRLPLAPTARPEDEAARPAYVVWELTLKCDLACVHCGSRAGRARKDELSTAEALRLVDEIAALGTREVTLIGGEAYLHEGWLDVAAAIARHGMRVSLVTGGQGMTAERARAAKDAGVTGVSVSVDGSEATHDLVRNKRGAHAAAMAAIANVRAAGLDASANTQITRRALREIEPMFAALVEAGIASWQVSMTVPMGRAADRPELLLQPWQILEVMPMLARIHALATARDVMVFPGNDIGYFGPYESRFRQSAPGRHRSSCTAGRHTMGIEADGAIKGCPSLPSHDYVGGNVRDAALVDIWERAEPLRFTRGRDATSLWGYCRTCYYAETCLGGCSWTAHVLFGRTGNNPYCHHRALELLAEGKRETIRAVERAPGVPFDHGRFACDLEDFPADEQARALALAASGQGWISEA